MTKVEQWPPPDWEEVVVTWEWLFEAPRRDIKALYNMILAQEGGNFYLYGKGNRHDFAFRFENPSDATWFRLMLPR